MSQVKYDKTMLQQLRGLYNAAAGVTTQVPTNQQSVAKYVFLIDEVANPTKIANRNSNQTNAYKAIIDIFKSITSDFLKKAMAFASIDSELAKDIKNVSDKDLPEAKNSYDFVHILYGVYNLLEGHLKKTYTESPYQRAATDLKLFINTHLITVSKHGFFDAYKSILEQNLDTTIDSGLTESIAGSASDDDFEDDNPSDDDNDFEDALTHQEDSEDPSDDDNDFEDALTHQEDSEDSSDDDNDFEDAPNQDPESQKTLQDIETHLKDYFQKLSSINQEKKPFEQLNQKAQFIKDGLEYLNKIASTELEAKKYSLDIHYSPQTLFRAATIDSQLNTHTLKYVLSHAKEALSVDKAVDVEMNQAIGWVEYINIKKTIELGDKKSVDIKSIIESYTAGQNSVQLATKLAYVEDALSSNSQDYNTTNVKVTHKVPGKFWGHSIQEKTETLSEFIETNLKHVAEDMFSDNTAEGLQYIDSCIDAINQYVTKTGVVDANIAHLVH